MERLYRPSSAGTMRADRTLDDAEVNPARDQKQSRLEIVAWLF
jgi:hypothetical protein